MAQSLILSLCRDGRWAIILLGSRAMPEVWLPPRLQTMTGGRQQVVVEGATVRQVINNLEREYPGTRDLIMDVEEDDLLPGLAVVVDGETSLLGLLERVQESSEVHFLPAIGGG